MSFAPSMFPLFAAATERFPIMDFYLKHCVETKIKGVCQQNLRLLDVGKLDSLVQAEQFVNLV